MKDGRLGGRVWTYNTKVKGKHYSMEAGAGRFNDNHKYLKKLINDMGLTKQIFKIPSSVQHKATKKDGKNTS